MSKEKRRVPKLRFPGFTEDWEQCKLSDITEVIMGQSPSSKNYTDNPNDDILVQGNADLKDGKVVPRLWTKEITKTIDKGGIILTVRAPVGDVAKTDYKVVLGRGVAGIKGNDYIYQFLQKLQYNRYWVSLSSGSTFESINSNDIKDLIIDIPSIEEQTKISMLLNNVNSIITLHQRKLDNLKLKKKALLQKLFPKNGEYYPELRFPGFTDAWEQREFSDIFSEVKSGLSRMLSNDDIGLPVVRANNINDGQLNLVDDIKYWYKNDPQGANTNNYLIEQGDILINFINSEAKMGTAAYVTRRPERDTIYTTNILRCKVNDEYNPYFIYSLTFLNSYKNYIASITKPAVNQASFTTVDFKKYSIKIPTVREQNQIADLIETFNKLITLHQRKLDHLQLQKKALLQQMFV